MTRNVNKLDPWTSDARDPLELIARMLVGGSYRVPVAGRSTVAPLNSSDIAGAVAYMGDELQRETALAVALRADRTQMAHLTTIAYRRVATQVRHLRPRPLDLREPADRWRLRLVVFDAVRELVWPEQRVAISQLAKAAKMRRSKYRVLHATVTGTLQQALDEGRTAFRRALFSGS